jgi:hypothetical protein
VKRLFDDMLGGVARDAKAGARRLLLTVIIGFAGCSIAVVGLGFLLAWAFMTLSMAYDARTAALFIGLACFILAGCVFGVLLYLRPSKPVVPEVPKPGPDAGDAETTDAASIAAFTAAFVLGRYMTRDKRS